MNNTCIENCGHRIHVLFMMYDVYWYCQMKKKERLWKFWKRKDYENFEKRGGVVEKRGGEEETKSMPRAPVVKTKRIQLVFGVSLSTNLVCTSHDITLYLLFTLYIYSNFCNIHVNLFNRGIFVNTKMYIV